MLVDCLKAKGVRLCARRGYSPTQEGWTREYWLSSGIRRSAEVVPSSTAVLVVIIQMAYDDVNDLEKKCGEMDTG